jgi:hypothetical protein
MDIKKEGEISRKEEGTPRKERRKEGREGGRKKKQWKEQRE